jgi:hypothetical protein
MSDNLKIPIIWHLGIVPGLETLLFTQKLHLWNRDMFRKSSLYVTVMVSPDLLSYSLSTSSAMKTPENKEDPDDPEPYEGDTQIQYTLISCTAQVQAQ